MCPGLGFALRLGRFFFDVIRTIHRMGQVTSDVVSGMSVTQSVWGWAHSYVIPFLLVPHSDDRRFDVSLKSRFSPSGVKFLWILVPHPNDRGFGF